MGTIDNFDVPAAASFDATDTVPVKDNSTSRGAYVTGTQIFDAVRQNLGAIVNTTATTLTITAASHAGKTVTVNSAAPIAVTLPAATGTGNVYSFWVGVAATATGHTIKVANTTDIMIGYVHALTTSSDNVIGYATSATSDTITLDGTTKGGVAGDWFEVTDVASGKFSVFGVTKATGSVATPFSASV